MKNPSVIPHRRITPAEALTEFPIQKPPRAKNAVYVNGGARERARLADPDLANGRPRSRSRWYA